MFKVKIGVPPLPRPGGQIGTSLLWRSFGSSLPKIG